MFQIITTICFVAYHHWFIKTADKPQPLHSTQYKKNVDCKQKLKAMIHNKVCDNTEGFKLWLTDTQTSATSALFVGLSHQKVFIFKF